jgi:hypothetical protein
MSRVSRCCSATAGAKSGEIAWISAHRADARRQMSSGCVVGKRDRIV